MKRTIFGTGTSLLLCAMFTGCADNSSTTATNAHVPVLYAGCANCTGAGTPSQVVTFALNSNSATPVATLSSAAGAYWHNVQVDSTGNIYVVDTAPAAPVIDVFAPGASGVATPIRTITSTKMTAGNFDTFFVARNGTMYYFDDMYGLEVFAAGSTGASTPTVTTFHSNCCSGGVDAAGNVFTPTANGFTVLPANFTASTPASVVAVTGIFQPGSLWLDTSGNIYEASATGGVANTTIAEIAPTIVAGTVTPLKTLSVPRFSYGVNPVADAAGNIYVQDNTSNIQILQYSATATGVSAAVNTIVTTLKNPMGTMAIQ